MHPGYGFLSESADFAERLWREANCVVLGPGWDVLARTGDKLAAKQLAQECGVPTLPATTTPTSSIDDVRKFARDVGFPVIVKAVDGGGGRGIRIVRDEEQLEALVSVARRESPSGQVFVERAAIDGFRHIEVQIIGDGHGNIRHLWERECSVQRRFQKVVEWAPSRVNDRQLIADVIEGALRMARKVKYMSLGTFEFLVREESAEWYFLEVNPRLQVEHTVTESICLGIDLVKLQLQIANGGTLSALLSLPDDPKTPPPLHSIQLRLTAEDASNDWALSIGKVTSLQLPSGNGIRVDTHMLSSPATIVKTDFDSLLAKLIVTGSTWEDSVAKSKRALADTRVEGVKTSLAALQGIVTSEDFLRGKCDTQWLEKSLPLIMRSGQQIMSSLSSHRKHLNSAPSSAAVTVSSASALIRRGDAWAVTLAPTDGKGNALSTDKPEPGHLQLTRILRNEFPQSLSASILYTPSSGPPQPFSMTLNATSASAGALASTSKHRRGDANNMNHVIVPFPGQMMEILVEEGDVIAKNDVLAVVRQMKMELEIRSKKAGKVIWACEVEEGEEVGEGLLVAELVDHDSKTGAPKL